MTRTTIIVLAGIILSAGPFFCSRPKQASSTDDRRNTTTDAKPLSDSAQAGESPSEPGISAIPDSTFVRRIGPVTVGRDRVMNVYVQITHVHLASGKQDGWPDSDTSFVVVDSLGRELFRRSAITTLGGAETDFDCFQFTIPTIGSTLACRSSIAPTNPGDGEDTQFLGLDSKGKLVALTAVIPQPASKVVFLDSRNTLKPIFVDPGEPFAKPAFEIQFWAGNFEVKAYYHIYPDGFMEGKQPMAFDFETIPVVVDSLEAQKERQRSLRANVTVLLCDKPNKDVTGTNRVPVGVNSKIKFLDAAYLGGWWLHVVIDGHEGYVPNRDFVYLGLPDAG